MINLHKIIIYFQMMNFYENKKINLDLQFFINFSILYKKIYFKEFLV